VAISSFWGRERWLLPGGGGPPQKGGGPLQKRGGALFFWGGEYFPAEGEGGGKKRGGLSLPSGVGPQRRKTFWEKGVGLKGPVLSRVKAPKVWKTRAVRGCPQGTLGDKRDLGVLAPEGFRLESWVWRLVNLDYIWPLDFWYNS